MEIYVTEMENESLVDIVFKKYEHTRHLHRVIEHNLGLFKTNDFFLKVGTSVQLPDFDTREDQELTSIWG